VIIDKQDLLGYIRQHKGDKQFEIEIGCGNRKRRATAIGIDKLDYPCVDIVGDMSEVLSSVPDGSIATVRSFHALEHTEEFGSIIRRVEQILRENGRLEIVVPHFSNPYFYSDYTHRCFFGLYSLSYLARDSIFRRRVPTYGVASALTLLDVRLRFKSTPPFYGRHAFKTLVGVIVNSSRFLQELYEEMFCWLCPCYEIVYYLEKRSVAASPAILSEPPTAHCDNSKETNGCQL
jgi:hypothetical protein